MTGPDVLELYHSLEQQEIKIWIDGGWAVDALLGKQTRDHEDVDVAVERAQLAALKGILESRGYRDMGKPEHQMWDFSARDGQGREIEVHAFTFGEDGTVIEQEYWDGYSVDSLTGLGSIQGQEVRCVSVTQLIKTHDKNKRELKDTDYQDMALLSEKFGVTFP